MLQCVPAITITNGQPGTAMPLCFVLFVEAFMRAYEDFTRHRSDRTTNMQRTQRLVAGEGAPRWADCAWEDVCTSETERER